MHVEHLERRETKKAPNTSAERAPARAGSRGDQPVLEDGGGRVGRCGAQLWHHVHASCASCTRACWRGELVLVGTEKEKARRRGHVGGAHARGFKRAIGGKAVGGRSVTAAVGVK